MTKTIRSSSSRCQCARRALAKLHFVIKNLLFVATAMGGAAVFFVRKGRVPVPTSPSPRHAGMLRKRGGSHGGFKTFTELHEVAYRRAGAAALQINYDELLDGMSGRFSFGPGDGYDEGSESDEEEEVGEEGDEWDGAEEESESDDDGGADYGYGGADGVTETVQAPRAGPSPSSETAHAGSATANTTTTATVCAAWLARLNADGADAPPPR